MEGLKTSVGQDFDQALTSVLTRQATVGQGIKAFGQSLAQTVSKYLSDELNKVLVQPLLDNVFKSASELLFGNLAQVTPQVTATMANTAALEANTLALGGTSTTTAASSVTGNSGGLFGFLGSLFGSSGSAATYSGALSGTGSSSYADVAALAASFSNGAPFADTNLSMFANGNSFSNSVVSEPTLFKFANGDKTGLMGEAGPEAIMPLTRGTDGKLGVASIGPTNPSQQMVDNSSQNVYNTTHSPTFNIQQQPGQSPEQMGKQLSEAYIKNMIDKRIFSANRPGNLSNRLTKAA